MYTHTYMHTPTHTHVHTHTHTHTNAQMHVNTNCAGLREYFFQIGFPVFLTQETGYDYHEVDEVL